MNSGGCSQISSSCNCPILIEVRFKDTEIGECLFKFSQFAHRCFDPVT